MKTFKYFIFLAVVLLFPTILKAQSVKYVAYFPIPYVTHMKIEADTAYFAGRDNGTLQIDGNLNLSAGIIKSNKDLKLTTKTNAATVSNTTMDVSVGNNNFSEYKGDFIVDNALSSLTVNALPSQMGSVNGDNIIKVKSISWGNNDAFVKGNTTPSDLYALGITAAPSSTTKFCWSPLRIKGTYEYQYYLIAISSGDCPN